MPSSKGSSWPKDGTCISLGLLHWQVGSLPLVPPRKHPMGFYCRLLFFFNLFFPPYFVYPVGFFQFEANVKKKKTKLLWALLCMSLCGCLLSFLLGKCLGMDWLSHVVGACLTFSETGKWLYHLTFPPIMYESSDCSTFCQHLEMVSIKFWPFW